MISISGAGRQSVWLRQLTEYWSSTGSNESVLSIPCSKNREQMEVRVESRAKHAVVAQERWQGPSEHPQASDLARILKLQITPHFLQPHTDHPRLNRRSQALDHRRVSAVPCSQHSGLAVQSAYQHPYPVSPQLPVQLTWELATARCNPMPNTCVQSKKCGLSHSYANRQKLEWRDLKLYRLRSQSEIQSEIHREQVFPLQDK